MKEPAQRRDISPALMQNIQFLMAHGKPGGREPRQEISLHRRDKPSGFMDLLAPGAHWPEITSELPLVPERHCHCHLYWTSISFSSEFCEIPVTRWSCVAHPMGNTEYKQKPTIPFLT